MPSLTDVAREAGVSLTTASMVLNKGKQHNRVSATCAQRVQEAAQRLGYVPNYHARSMKLGRAEVLAVALDVDLNSNPSGLTSAELSDPYLSRLISGIQARVRGLGYLMTLVGPDAMSCAPDRALVGLRQRRFDGIIVPAMCSRNPQSLLLSQPADCPVVVIESSSGTPHAHVTFDEPAAIDAAVSHLASLGHRSILQVIDHLAAPGGQGRTQAFSRVCQKHEISHDTCDLALPPSHDTRHPDKLISEVAAAFASKWNHVRTRPTAIMACSDVVAVGVIEALSSHGLRVPTDISVVGFDDTIAPYATPRLTTISHELAEMGRCAVDLCMEMVNNPARILQLQGTTTTVRPRLVERASTAPTLGQLTTA